MIDIVIPTMWLADEFLHSLKIYVEHSAVRKIILIDNNKKKRPDSPLFDNKKVELVCYNSNIFVNPAWNEGVNRTRSNIIAIINDDILVKSEVFDMILEFDLKPGDLVGVNLRGYQDNYKIDDVIDTEEKIVRLKYRPAEPIGGQAWAFGICMFMHRETYKPIPSLYQVWYGDDYLVQNAESVYALNTNKIKGKISETIGKFNDPNSDVSKRIELDSKNFLKFDHFKNGKNWDIPKNMIRMYADQRAVKKTDVFELEYRKAKSTPSDINENVHILYDLAKECKHVTEMGVRTGVSTRALLNSDVELTSYDIVLNQAVADLFDMAKKVGKKARYIKANVLNIEIEETDMLFIDTLHTYSQLKQELLLHSNKVHKYIALHDTYSFGLTGEDGRDKKGLLSAVLEFIMENPQWALKIYKTNNNGFTVLERKNEI